ncbi:LOW QUALITY PROTEIN: tRNA-dihydrouridine(47) synthase [NAD(P)(+)]-like [Pterocles gutturalis]
MTMVEEEMESPDDASRRRLDLSDVVRPRVREMQRQREVTVKVEIQCKLYLAPLTTCGNLPFQRICKCFGADVTCGEMAVCTNLLQGQSSKWALLKRHHSEDIFEVQLEGAFPDTMTKCAELLNQTIEVDFVDINIGCPVDLVYKKGGGCALMTRSNKFEQNVRGMNSVLDVPLTVKIRMGVQEKIKVAHKLISKIRDWGAAMVTLHGRSREQWYTRSADWDYIAECAKTASPMPLFGNGDILSYEDANRAMQLGVLGIMIAMQVPVFPLCYGALIKPWLFTEIKEQRHWDISSSERFDILKDFTNYGLEHWGSDTQGVEKTRKLLEWLSFLCRYIPVGLLEYLPQKINERPPYNVGRDYLETLMASQNVRDWTKISGNRKFKAEERGYKRCSALRGRRHLAYSSPLNRSIKFLRACACNQKGGTASKTGRRATLGNRARSPAAQPPTRPWRLDTGRAVLMGTAATRLQTHLKTP